MQLEGKQGPWPVCMGSLVILTPFWWESHHQLQLQEALGRGLQEMSRRDQVLLQLAPATCISKPDKSRCSLAEMGEAQTRGP